MVPEDLGDCTRATRSLAHGKAACGPRIDRGPTSIGIAQRAFANGDLDYLLNTEIPPLDRHARGHTREGPVGHRIPYCARNSPESDPAAPNFAAQKAGDAIGDPAGPPG